jgi:hypothetical protein
LIRLIGVLHQDEKNDGPIEAAVELNARGCSSLIFPREWEVLEQGATKLGRNLTRREMIAAPGDRIHAR